MKAQITFKSGAQITVDIDAIETSRHRVTGKLTEMQWVTPDGWTAKLHTVDIEEIVAIVALKDPEEKAE